MRVKGDRPSNGFQKVPEPGEGDASAMLRTGAKVRG